MLFEFLCMYINYILIYEAQRNTLLLTVFDVFSRMVLLFKLMFNIKNTCWNSFIITFLIDYKIEGITLRYDNCSQFIASIVT